VPVESEPGPVGPASPGDATGPAKPKPGPGGPGVPVSPATPPVGCGTAELPNANAVTATTSAEPARAKATARPRPDRRPATETTGAPGIPPTIAARPCRDGSEGKSGVATIETPQAGHQPTARAQQRWQA
jgi:hypothetical protein